MDEVSRVGVALFHLSLPVQQALGKASRAKRRVTKIASNNVARPIQQSIIRRSSVIPTSDPSQGVPLETFTLFTQLPIELRNQIWHMTLPPPRVLRVENGPKRLEKLVKRTRQVPLITPAAYPIILHVCRESRLEALRFYTAAFGIPGVFDPRVYIDLGHDTVLFEKDATVPYRECVADLAQVTCLAIPQQRAAMLAELPASNLASLREVQVLLPISRGPSFRLGSTPRLQEISAEMAEGVAASERAFRAADLIRTRFEERQEEFKRCLPVVKVVEFVKSDGDEWVTPPRQLAYARIPSGLVWA